MIIAVTQHINRIINVSRDDVDVQVNRYIDMTSRESKIPTIYSFFNDIVMHFDWTRIMSTTELDTFYSRFDGDEEKPKIYFRFLDIFERSIRTFLIENNINFDNYITAIAQSYTNPTGYNTGRSDILGSTDKAIEHLRKHTWLATIYILANTDLYYILSIDTLTKKNGLATLKPGSTGYTLKGP